MFIINRCVPGCPLLRPCLLDSSFLRTRRTMMILVNRSPSVPASTANNQSKRFPDSTRSRPIDSSTPEAWISRRSWVAPHAPAKIDGESLSWEKSLNHHNRKTWTHCPWSRWSRTALRIWLPLSRWLEVRCCHVPRPGGLTRRQTPSALSSSTPARWWRSARACRVLTSGPVSTTAGAMWW